MVLQLSAVGDPLLSFKEKQRYMLEFYVGHFPEIDDFKMKIDILSKKISINFSTRLPHLCNNVLLLSSLNWIYSLNIFYSINNHWKALGHKFLKH